MYTRDGAQVPSPQPPSRSPMTLQYIVELTRLRLLQARSQPQSPPWLFGWKGEDRFSVRKRAKLSLSPLVETLDPGSQFSVAAKLRGQSRAWNTSASSLKRGWTFSNTLKAFSHYSKGVPQSRCPLAASELFEASDPVTYLNSLLTPDLKYTSWSFMFCLASNGSVNAAEQRGSRSFRARPWDSAQPLLQGVELSQIAELHSKTWWWTHGIVENLLSALNNMSSLQEDIAAHVPPFASRAG